MKVFVTGATGLVGTALCRRLLAERHEVLAWVRDEAAARKRLGSEVELVAVADGDDALAAALGRADAVVNLAGAPVAKRWSASYRKTLVRSRVDLTQRVVDTMRAVDRRPGVLISASAVGYYGARGDERLTEDSAAGDGFLAELCVNWEAATKSADALGTRTCWLRLGIVLDENEGALAAMRTPFSLGMGAVLGSGSQYSPFIHIDDLVALLMTALVDDRYRGPINAVAPQAVTHREFCKQLGRSMNRPVVLRGPSFVLRMAMGDAASILLEGQRVIPARATELGFEFRFPDIASALDDVVG